MAKCLTLLCSSTGTLSSIPTALTRWTEECKVLDAESMHDCVSGVWWQLSYQGSSEPSSADTSTWKVVSLVLWGHKLCLFGSSIHLAWEASDLCFFDPVVKVPIVNHLEFLRDEELEERREKRRKQLAEEETKITDKGKEDKENRDQNSQVIPKGLGRLIFGCVCLP